MTSAATGRRSRAARSSRTRFVAWLAVFVSVVGILALPNRVEAAQTVWIDEGFDDSLWHDGSDWWNWLAGDYIETSQIAGVTGDGAQITVEPGVHAAAMLNHQFAIHSQGQPDEGWFRYWMRFDDLPLHSGKLPGFMGLYSDSARGLNPPSESEPGWSARVLFGPGSDSSHVRLGYYTYHLDQPGTAGETMNWSEEIPLDTWVCIEGKTTMNDPGVKNGELSAWIDGSSVFDQSDLYFRSGTQSNVHIREFMFEVYYGGSSTPSYDTSISFDDLVVADSRVGCDLPPPPPPSEFRFDDTPESIFRYDIEWLAEAGITKGCNPPGNTLYCPERKITRGEMSAFLHRALNGLVPTDALPDPPAHPPTMWGVQQIEYKDSLSTMTSAGHPLDLIHLDHSMDQDWRSSGGSERSSWVPLQMSNIADAGAVPYIEFVDTDISAFNDGQHNTDFNAWVDVMTDWLDDDLNHKLVIAPFPEANNKTSAYGDDAPAFKTAYTKVRDAFRDQGYGGSRVRFSYQVLAEMRSDRYSTSTHGNGYALFAPDSDEIDLAAIAWFNKADPDWDDWNSFYKDRVNELGERIGVDVPVLLSAVASAPSGDSVTRVDWFDSIADGINAHRSVIGFIYMDHDRTIDYSVGTTGSPEAGLLDALDSIDDGRDAIGWLFSDADAWRAEMRASSTGSVFDDDDTTIFRYDIAWLIRIGAAVECGENSFCPDEYLRRDEMAAMMERALSALVPPDLVPDPFTDISGSPYPDEIVWLASTGITKGCNPPANDRFCPDRVVDRGQMAAFFHRGLADLLD
jgi:hypothetical protein